MLRFGHFLTGKFHTVAVRTYPFFQDVPWDNHGRSENDPPLSALWRVKVKRFSLHTFWAVFFSQSSKEGWIDSPGGRFAKYHPIAPLALLLGPARFPFPACSDQSFRSFDLIWFTPTKGSHWNLICRMTKFPFDPRLLREFINYKTSMITD